MVTDSSSACGAGNLQWSVRSVLPRAAGAQVNPNPAGRRSSLHSTCTPVRQLPIGTHLSSDFARLGVPANLVSALAGRGITIPTPIQAATLPDSLSGRDVLGR